MMKPVILRVKQWLEADQPRVVEQYRPTLTPMASMISLHVIVPCSKIKPNKWDITTSLSFFVQEVSARLSLINQNPLFVDLTKAKRHALFHIRQHVIIKIVVPESAVTGTAHKLRIKPGALRLEHINGCYFSSDHYQHYRENPFFADDSLSN